jgi:Uma2 family endonuclease
LSQRGLASLPIAPEICIEARSLSNTLEELDEKRRLYAAKGCVEFWTCAENGAMRFQRASDGVVLEKSVLCPAFPLRIEL